MLTFYADILLGDESGPADLLLSQKTIRFRSTEIPIEVAGYPKDKIRRVTVADDYIIPAMSETLVQVFVEREETEEQADFILEPDPSLAERYSLAMAASMVDINRTVTQAVRLMNPFPTPTKLHQNSLIGYAEPVEEVTVIKEIEDSPEKTNMNSIRNIVIGEEYSDEDEAGTSTTDVINIPEHLIELFEETAKDKSPEEITVLQQFFTQNQDVFSKNDLDIGRTYLTEHVIETEEGRPFKSAPRRIPLQFIDEADAAVQKLFDQGTVRESTSPWASPLVFVRKKNGQLRPCVDYRRLNAVTRKDAYPLPRTQDCFDAVAGSTLFSSMDITSAYNQIPIREKDIPKTAFVTKHGLFEFTTMPFGLCNAPATFERLMELALAGLQWKICLIYLDDVLVFSKTFDEHMNRLNAVLDRIRKANLKLKPVKCHFLRPEVAYLGHILSAEGVQPNPDNLAKVQAWKQPTTVKEVQSFLGLANYYRRFIQDYSYHVRPLIDLTKKNKFFNWTEDCTKAFQFVKEELTSPPIMSHPSREGDFILDTDASLVSIGAVLSQIQDGEVKVLAYGSKSLSKTEQNYCVTDRELLAVRYFTEYYRCYLLGKKFLIRTDHQALKWLFSMKEPKNRIARWIEALSEFDFSVEHRAGQKHGNADAMSRCPNPWQCDCKAFDKLRCGPCPKCIRKTELMDGLMPDDKVQEIRQKAESQGTAEKICKSKQDLRNAWPLKTTMSDVKKKQSEDKDIAMVLQWKKADKRPLGPVVSAAGQTVRHYWLLWDSLLVKDDILYRWFHKKDGTSNLQVILPKTLRQEVLFHMHDDLLSGHLGTKKTCEKILQNFYWFGVRDDVYTYVQSCDTCTSIKGSVRKPKAPLGEMPTGAPLDRLSTDVLGPLPESHQGNKYVLVVTDHFTRWVEIFAIPDQTATTCAEKILDEVIARFGCPYDLHSDQGRNYVSQIFVDLCKLLEIRKTRSSPYNPRCNGQAERFNRTLVQMIKSYIKGQQRDWDKHLGCLAGAYRATVHESTGYTPNRLMLGREVRLPAQLMFNNPTNHEIDSYCDYVVKLRDSMEHAHEVAREHLNRNAKRQKEHYDAKSLLHVYKAGDLAWYASEAGEYHITPKLRKSFVGPVLIVQKYNDLNFRIQVDAKKMQKVVHHNKLLPYHGSQRPRWIAMAMKNIK